MIIDIEDKDVILLKDGRLLQVIDCQFKASPIMVQFIDRDEPSYLDPNTLDYENNLQHSPSVLLNFHANRSIHMRLNRMGRL